MEISPAAYRLWIALRTGCFGLRAVGKSERVGTNAHAVDAPAQIKKIS